MDRYFVKFPSSDILKDLLKPQATTQGQADFKTLYSQPDVALASLNDRQIRFFEQEGATVFPDHKLQIMPGRDENLSEFGDGTVDAKTATSLRDVVESIRAPEAWRRTKGVGTTIVVLDEGISPGLNELPYDRRSPLNLPTYYENHHWEDNTGHGSMCAAIAAGSKGRYDGVAPDAMVVSAKTNLFATDIADIYDALLKARHDGVLTGPVIVSNSFGFQSCDAPLGYPVDHPFFKTIENAVDAGLFVCFAAGNNHQTCQNDPVACEPTTIWGAASLDCVMSVGTVNQMLSNRDPTTPHVDSSRGPGQWAVAFEKPDCVAPTHGEVPWGASYRTMAWWGTSGACPQVAGLAALILSILPSMRPADVCSVIRSTCDKLPGGKYCVGSGLIDCAAAVNAAIQLSRVVPSS